MYHIQTLMWKKESRELLKSFSSEFPKPHDSPNSPKTRPRQRPNEVRQGLGPRPHYRLTLMKLVASGNGAVASSEKLLPSRGGDLLERWSTPVVLFVNTAVKIGLWSEIADRRHSKRDCSRMF